MIKSFKIFEAKIKWYSKGKFDEEEKTDEIVYPDEKFVMRDNELYVVKKKHFGGDSGGEEYIWSVDKRYQRKRCCFDSYRPKKDRDATNEEIEEYLDLNLLRTVEEYKGKRR
jgi:hypothetical protein